MRDLTAFFRYLEERRDWAFGYAHAVRTHDCARFCGGGVEAATGRNPLAAFAGSWSSEAGARRVLARHGGMATAVDTVMTRIPVTQARRADVAMTAEGQLVLVEGEQLVGLHPERGYVRLPRTAAAIAWSAT